MLFAMRVTLPDRPGMLAQVALSLSELGADVVTLEVVQREDGLATDDICVEAGDGLAEALRRMVERVPGVAVEAIRPVKRPPDPGAPLELASRLSTGKGDAVETLVRDLPDALSASWCLALAPRPEGHQVLAASAEAPMPDRIDLPWLPLGGPERLEPAGWMPSAWRKGAGLGQLDLAGAPLSEDGAAVLLARAWGARFRAEEIRQLGHLARIAGARARD